MPGSNLRSNPALSLSSRSVLVFLVLFLAGAGSSLTYAERVKGIRKAGILELSDGRLVRLGGIELAPESGRLLPAFLAGRDVDVQYDEAWPEVPGAARAAYLYVVTRGMKLPFAPNAPPKKNRVLLNAMMLALGAGRVEQGGDFKQRGLFLRAEAEAREKGEGIWSYNF